MSHWIIDSQPFLSYDPLLNTKWDSPVSWKNKQHFILGSKTEQHIVY